MPMTTKRIVSAMFIRKRLVDGGIAHSRGAGCASSPENDLGGGGLIAAGTLIGAIICGGLMGDGAALAVVGGGLIGGGAALAAACGGFSGGGVTLADAGGRETAGCCISSCGMAEGWLCS